MIEKSLNIILVEDDLNLGFLLVEFLESRGFQVKLYRDGESGFNGFRNGSFNFCIFDVMLPRLDGFALAQKVKSLNPNVPIIFLTAKGMKEDKLKGYNIGADDYITKPFDEDELLCRIQAIANRVDFSETGFVSEYQMGKYTFDFANHALIINGEVKRLTSREAEILKMLCINKNNVVRREQLLIAIWGENDYFAGRSLDVFISKLRKYLSNDPDIKIENITKVGFVLSC